MPLTAGIALTISHHILSLFVAPSVRLTSQLVQKELGSSALERLAGNMYIYIYIFFLLLFFLVIFFCSNFFMII